jgi:hypothetical protein
MSDEPKKRDSLALALLIGSGAVFLLTMLGSGAILVFAGASLIIGNPEAARSSYTLSILLFCLAALTLPGLYYAWQAPRPETHRHGLRLPKGIILLAGLFPVTLIAGTGAADIAGLEWTLPILHVLAAGIPVLLAAALVIQQGTAITPVRAWGSFQSGLWLSPALALVFEIVLAIPLLILLFMVGADTLNTPELLQGFSQTRGVPDTYLFEQLNALLGQPLVLIGIFGYLSVAVPLIEEAAKSVALWFTARRQVTLSLAFMSGAIAGGGYGLFEAFFLAQPGEDWLLLMIARAGASIMHMFAAGLTGLGVGYVIIRRRYWRGIALYLAAVVLHGIWNLAALGIGLVGLTEVVNSPAISATHSMLISVGSGIILLLMSTGALMGLWRLPKILPGCQSGSVIPGASSGDSTGTA